ncbi:MAG: DUF4296 domain-containing protein [Bacteroidota bacterium]|nr:DUF4296 domain-containing protein [Bacteroidota bacterium]
MKKGIYYIIGLLLLLGCETKSEVPANLLPKEKFEAVLHDIILLQAVQNTDFAYVNANNIDAKEIIFKKHQTDSLQFAESSQYYSLDIDLYEQILDNILEKIRVTYSNPDNNSKKE